MSRAQGLACVAMIACGFIGGAFAQCEEWLPTPEGSFPGVAGQGRCVASWDPDGDGPEPALAVVGSIYPSTDVNSIGGVHVWDGQSWRPLGALRLRPWALAVYRNELYVAAGTSTQTEALPGVYRWTGDEWVRVVGPGGATTGEEVFSLAVWNDTLVAAGNFLTIGGTQASNIAAWNGAAWEPLGPGLPSRALGLAVFGGDVYSCAGAQVYRFAAGGGRSVLPPSPIDIAGAFYRVKGSSSRGVCFSETHNVGGGGGDSQRLAFWNGSAWTQVTNMFGTSLADGIVEYRGREYMADYGYFNVRHVNGGVIEISGPWLPGLPAATALNSCSALCAHAGGLLVAGSFIDIDGAPAKNVSWFDGTNWRVLGDGISTQRVNALTGTEDDLYVGAQYLSDQTFDTMGQVWRRRGGLTTKIFQVEAGGESIALCSGAPGTFVSTYYGLQRFDGVAWSAFPLPTPQEVTLLGEYRGRLIAASAGGLFRYDQGWTQITATVVNALATVGDDLYVGGNFQAINGVAASRVARYDGTTFHALGEGLTGTVNKLAADGNRVWATQPSGTAGAEGGWQVWEFAEGAWRSIGVADSGRIYMLAADRGRLYASGDFSQLGVPAVGIVAWDGQQWSALGDMLHFTIVYAALPLDNALLFGGEFRHASDDPVNVLRRWGRSPALARSDVDCGGGVDGSDVGVFFEWWERGSVLADFDEDGAVDGADVGAFFELWEAGR